MIIREIDLFEGMNEEIEQELAKVMEGESYNSGEVIIKEGAVADNFYMLQAGALNVKVAGARQTTHVAKDRKRQLAGPVWPAERLIPPRWSVLSRARLSRSTKTNWIKS